MFDRTTVAGAPPLVSHTRSGRFTPRRPPVSATTRPRLPPRRLLAYLVAVALDAGGVTSVVGVGTVLGLVTPVGVDVDGGAAT